MAESESKNEVTGNVVWKIRERQFIQVLFEEQIVGHKKVLG